MICFSFWSCSRFCRAFSRWISNRLCSACRLSSSRRFLFWSSRNSSLKVLRFGLDLWQEVCSTRQTVTPTQTTSILQASRNENIQDFYGSEHRPECQRRLFYGRFDEKNYRTAIPSSPTPARFAEILQGERVMKLV